MADGKNGNGRKKREYSNYLELSSIGLTLVFSTFIGFGIGMYLDKILGTKPVFMIVFLILGIISGFINLFRVAFKLSKKK